MYFCGQESRYIEGQEVTLKGGERGKIIGIGILGSKLSKWLFLYDISCENGKNFSVTEEGIVGLK